MIETGKSFCPHCVSVHTGAYYSNKELDWGVWLKRSVVGNKYKVVPEDFKRSTAPKGTFTLKSNVKESDHGVPLQIQIQVTENKSDGTQVTKTLMMFRACPNCAEEKKVYQPILREVGKYPTFVITMIGNRSAGKSAWLDSIATNQSVDLVNDQQYANMLEYVTPAIPAKRPAATKIESRGQTKLLQIVNRVDRQVIALVYLVDVGGELFDPKHAENETKWRLMTGSGDYPGADAFVFVAPAVNNRHGAALTAAVHAELVQKGLIAGKPLAFVLTHADTMIQQKQFRQIPSTQFEREVPVITEDTFALDRPTSYAREALLKRVALEHMIAKAYDSPIPVGQGHGFLVRSCDLREDDYVDEEGNQKREVLEDFTKSLNVMDPLLWILNQLKLFPL